jgi:quercetin dioxygenase-like cupin family protein
MGPIPTWHSSRRSAKRDELEGGIVRVAKAGRTGKPSEQRGATFTGRVWADPVLPAEDGIMVSNVFFEPAARTHWHRHELAQVLQVLAGEGRVQSRDGSGSKLQAGDTVHIPAGEEHWHGAAPESYLLHLAVSVGVTEWLEAVSAEDYASAAG